MSKLFKKEIDYISVGVSLGKKTSGVDHPKLMVVRPRMDINDEVKERIIENRQSSNLGRESRRKCSRNK